MFLLLHLPEVDPADAIDIVLGATSEGQFLQSLPFYMELLQLFSQVTIQGYRFLQIKKLILL